MEKKKSPSTMNGEKANDSTPSENRVVKVNHRTKAAKWNRSILRDIERALKSKPEADIITLLSPKYSSILAAKKELEDFVPTHDSIEGLSGVLHHTILAYATAESPCTILCDLSDELACLLASSDEGPAVEDRPSVEEGSAIGERPVTEERPAIEEGPAMRERILQLLDASDVMYNAGMVTVFRLSDTIVVKASGHISELVNEYRTLSYIAQNLADFPAPQPHGVVSIGHTGLLFNTFVPGSNLEKSWPDMAESDKRSISAELDTLFCRLRSIPFPEGTPLGGLEGAGCRDLRKFCRDNSTPIMDATQFQDFIFSGMAERSTPVYRRFLRNMTPAAQASIVFTHGDVRPANIIVRKNDDGSKNDGGTWSVAAILDWATSGFYPDYWEAAKSTNCLSPFDRWDWYDFLPESISPQRYRTEWLVDRLLDRSMENSF